MRGGFYGVGRLVVAAAILVVSACGTHRTDDDPKVLATYRNGMVTVDDVDAAILELPAAQRQLAGSASVEATADLVRRLAVERILVESADLEMIRKDSEFLRVHDENRQRIVAQTFIRKNLSGGDEITDEDVREFFDEHREELRQAPRRLVSHIYRRLTPEISVDAAAAELEDVRERVVRGESFGALARTTSDSETAASDGQLGWLERDQLPVDLAGVVFGLEKGVPSRPVVTAEGVHLFLVLSEAVSRDPELEEVWGQIVGVLRTRRQQAAVAELVAALPKPEPYFEASAEDLGFLLEGGDAGVVVLQVGSYSLDLGGFRAYLDRALSSRDSQPVVDVATNLLGTLAGRAKIYEHCRAEAILDEQALSSRLDEAFVEDAGVYLRERALLDEALRDQDRLQVYYDANRSRYSSPLLLDLEILSVPIPDVGVHELMDRLSRLDSSSGDDRLEQAAGELGGSIERIDGLPVSRLAAIMPRIAGMVSTQAVGEVSRPFRAGQTVRVIEVTRRMEPQMRDYATVSDLVLRDFIDDHRQQLYDEWSERTLDEVDFEILEDHLDAFATGTPRSAH